MYMWSHFKPTGDLTRLKNFVALNIKAMEAWKPQLFTVPVEELSIGKGTLSGTHVFARLLNPNY